MKVLKHNKLKKNEKLKHYKRKEIKIIQSTVQKLTTVYMYVQVQCICIYQPGSRVIIRLYGITIIFNNNKNVNHTLS